MKDFLSMFLFVALVFLCVFIVKEKDNIRDHGIEPYLTQLWEGGCSTNCTHHGE